MSNDGFDAGQEPAEESPHRSSADGPIGNDLDDAVTTNSPPQCSTDNDCCHAARLNFSRMLHSITELAKQTSLLEKTKKENDHISQQLVYLNEYVGEIIKKRDDLAEECAQAKATCLIATRREKELDDSLTAAESNLEKLQAVADEGTKYKSKYFFASQVLQDLQMKRQNYAINTNKLSAVCDTLRTEAQNKDRMIDKLKEDKNAAMDRLKAYRKYVPMLLKTVDELVTQNVDNLAAPIRKRIDLLAQPSIRSQLLGGRAQGNDVVDQEEQHSDDDMVDDLEDLIRSGVKAPPAAIKTKISSRRESTPVVHFDERLGYDSSPEEDVPVKTESVAPRGRGNRRTSPTKRRGEASRKGRNIPRADEVDMGRMAQLKQKLSRANEEASTSASASATTRSTIHGRKGMTVREQQAQQAKMTVKERVALLKKKETGSSILPTMSEKKVDEDLRLSPSPVKQPVLDAGGSLTKSMDLYSELRLSPSPVKHQEGDGYEHASFYSYEDMDSVLPETQGRQAAFSDLNIDVTSSEVNPLAPTNDQIRTSNNFKAPTIRPSPSLPHLEVEWPSALTNRVLEIIEKVCVVEVEPRLSPPRMVKRPLVTNVESEIPPVSAAQSSFVVTSEQEVVAPLEETIPAIILEEDNSIVHDIQTSASSTVSVSEKVSDDAEKIKEGAEDEMDFEDDEQILHNILKSRKISRPVPVDSPSEEYRAERIEQAFIESQEQKIMKPIPFTGGAKKKVEVKKSPSEKKRPSRKESTSESEPKHVPTVVEEKEHAETSQPLPQQEHIKSPNSSVSQPVEAAVSIAPPAPVFPRKSNIKAKTAEKSPPTASTSREAEKQDELVTTEVPQKLADKLPAETPAVMPRRTSRRLSARTSMSPAHDVPKRITRSSSVCQNEMPPIAGKEGSTSSMDNTRSRRSASTMVTRSRKASESSNDGTAGVFKAPARRASRMKPSAPKAKASLLDSDVASGSDAGTSESTAVTAESSVVFDVVKTSPVIAEYELAELLATPQKRIAHKTQKEKIEPTKSSVMEKVIPSPRRTTRLSAISPKEKRSTTPEPNETTENIYKPLKKTPICRNLEPSDFNTVLITGDDLDNDDSTDIPQLENDEQAATDIGADLQIADEGNACDADSSNYSDPYADLQIDEETFAEEDESDGLKIAIDDKQQLDNVPDHHLKKAKDEATEEEEIPTTSLNTVSEKSVKETVKEPKTTRQSKKPSSLSRLRSQLSVGAPPSAQMAKMASMLSKRTGSSVSQKTIRKAAPPKASAADSKVSASTSAKSAKVKTTSAAAVSESEISTIPATGPSPLAASTPRISKAGQSKVPVIPVLQPLKRARKRDNDAESATQVKKARVDESAHSLKKNAVDVVLKKHSAESLLEKALDMECDYDGIRAKISDEEINLIQTLSAEVFAKVLTDIAIRRQTGDMWMSVWTNYLKQNVESVSNKAEEALVEAAFKICPDGMNIFAPFVRNLLEFMVLNTFDANTCYKIVRLICFSIKNEYLGQNTLSDAGNSIDPEAVIQSMLSFIANENPSYLGVSFVYLLLKLEFNPFLRFLATPQGHTLFQIAALYSMKDVRDVIIWIWSAKFEYLSDHRLILHTDMSALLRDLAISVDDIHVKDGKYEMSSKLLELKMWSTIMVSNDGSSALQNHIAATEKAIDEVLKHYGLVENPVIEGLGNLFTDIMKPSVKTELPLDMLKNLAFHLLLLKTVFPGLLTTKHVFNTKKVFSGIADCYENIHILYTHLTEKLSVPSSEKQQLLMTTVTDFIAQCRFLSMYSL